MNMSDEESWPKKYTTWDGALRFSITKLVDFGHVYYSASREPPDLDLGRPASPFLTFWVAPREYSTRANFDIRQPGHKYIGLGIGSFIMSEAIKEAKEMGWSFLFADIERPLNDAHKGRLEKFYRKHQFELVHNGPVHSVRLNLTQ